MTDSATMRNARIILPPEPSDWQCRLNPHTVFRPQKGDEPNAFHRFMQRLAFGIRWGRAKRP